MFLPIISHISFLSSTSVMKSAKFPISLSAMLTTEDHVIELFFFKPYVKPSSHLCCNNPESLGQRAKRFKNTCKGWLLTTGHDWIEKKQWQVRVQRKEMGQGSKVPMKIMRRIRVGVTEWGMRRIRCCD